MGNYFADMATKPSAARLLTADAARKMDAGEPANLESAMAKLFAVRDRHGDRPQRHAQDLHGGYGYSTEFDIERYFRDAPLMMLGEGTNEVLKGVIARELVRRGRR